MNSFAAMWPQLALLFSFYFWISFCIDCKDSPVSTSNITISSRLNRQHGAKSLKGLSDEPWVGGTGSSNWVSLEFPKPIKLSSLSMTGGDVVVNGTVVKCHVEIFLLEYKKERSTAWERYKPKFLNVTPVFNKQLKELINVKSINITVKKYTGCPAVNLELNCVDNNECTETPNVCGPDEICRNTFGSYYCICQTGFTGNNCRDIDECTENSNACHGDADCTNTAGSYSCNCKDGFTGNGRSSCKDIDECTENSNACHGDADCTNTAGSYSCNCKDGFTGNGRSCRDIDECAKHPYVCDRLAVCHNTPGSYSCNCNPGYSGDGKNNCGDINECTEDPNACGDNAECENNIGSYLCNCNDGYAGDKKMCKDINECNQANLCNLSRSKCVNTPGSYHCKCDKGYTGVGFNCSDIDECGLHKCSRNADCINTVGSFICTCRKGYRGDGMNCIGQDAKITSIRSSNTENKFRFRDRLELFCNASGLPVPKIEWKKEGDDAITHKAKSVNSTKYLWAASTLVIKSLKLNDAGLYNCTAKNEEMDIEGIFVQVIGTPTSPKATIKEVTDTDIHVSWEKPLDSGSSDINRYVVYYYDTSNAKKKSEPFLGDKWSGIISNLSANTEYAIWVVAGNEEGESEHDGDLVHATTLAPKPVALPQPEMGRASDTSVKIQVKKFDSQSEAALQVIVQKVSERRKRSTSGIPNRIYGYKEAKCEELTDCYYIAAEIQNIDIEFVVGDGKMYGNYKNVELEPSTTYNIYTRGVSYNKDKKVNYGDPSPRLQISTKGPGSSAESDDGSVVGLAVGLSVVVVVLIILAFLAFIYIRSKRPQTIEIDPETGEKKGRKKMNSELLPLTRKTHGKRKSGQVEDGSPDPNHPPVATTAFAKYVGKLHKSDDRGFMIQYNTLETSQTYTSDFATSPENKEKNRYANIVAYDVSRVHLKLIDDDDNSSYINASLVDGYNSANAYIATQGPLPGTFNDFWRMVWERNCSSIVMLTNLQERHKLKCHKYWPEESEVYGEITVIATRREQYADYVIRTFLLKMNETEEEREIKQFHFTVWPDHGVPEYPTAILAFQRRVRAYSTRDSGPLAVHCSAGVGRSGTFIVIDCMLARIQSEQAVDIYNYVRYLRTRRMYMVQTEEQYVFCHDALLESILCGNTQMAAHNLRIEMNKLRDRDATTKLTGYEAEFKTLNKVSPSLPKESFTVATYPVNSSKNRYHDILASDHDRVILGDEDDKDDGPYINAVYVDGYKQQNAFVLTQAPLKDTIKDFWQMMYEKHSACVLLLTNLTEEEGDFPQFWPDEGSEDYDVFNVELVSDASKGDTGSEDQFQQEKLSKDIVERKFKITKEEDKSLVIKMFQHLSWTETSVPTDISAIVSLIQRIEKWQQHSGNGPITIVCNDGQGRSGTLAALCSVLERVKTEQVVDVFQTIKALRIQRPGLVKHVEQYQFIHLGVQEYLDSFADYANFK
ncbi:receptor-type tyrosine-protein phosphatase S-like [Dendronephthya gigantea]|uniref:receptor-type tyrosine-protein phosphatase S-like n=1 Tax=Dendronephthya gigantea TaxID=151771 RepID=UPI001069DFED|nr:receptor-type tyrosine-protein phosphatase S-like [Dendronephthya gigantea]